MRAILLAILVAVAFTACGSGSPSILNFEEETPNISVIQNQDVNQQQGVSADDKCPDLQICDVGEQDEHVGFYVTSFCGGEVDGPTFSLVAPPGCQITATEDEEKADESVEEIVEADPEPSPTAPLVHQGFKQP